MYTAFQFVFGVGRGCKVTHNDGVADDLPNRGSEGLVANFQEDVNVYEGLEEDFTLVSLADDIGYPILGCWW